MTSLAFNLSICVVLFASVCLAAPFFERENSTSMVPEETTFLPRTFEETTESFTTSTMMEPMETTERTETTKKMTNKTSNKVFKDGERESEEDSRERRQYSETSTLMTVGSVIDDKISEAQEMITTIASMVGNLTEKLVNITSEVEEKVQQRQMPEESTTTIKMTSTSTKLPKKYLGHFEERAEDENEKENEHEHEHQKDHEEEHRQEKEPEQEQHEEQEQEDEKKTKYQGKQSEGSSTSVKSVSKDRSAGAIAHEKVESEDLETKNTKVAEYDPKALERISTVETIRLYYDENNQSIPDLSREMNTQNSTEEYSSTEEKSTTQKMKILDQAKKSPVVKEKKSNY